MTLDIKL